MKFLLSEHLPQLTALRIFIATILTVAMFVFANTSPAQQTAAKKNADKSLNHLKTWAGKLPRNPKSKKFRDFFALPEIKRQLQKMLDTKDFNVLINDDFRDSEPIEIVGDYLVIMGTNKAGNAPLRHTQIAIGLKNGFINIWHVEGKKIWGTSNSSAQLPEEIEDKIMKYREN